jgi:hypothetical protein
MSKLAKLLEVHQHNLLATAKIRAVISEVAQEWGVVIQMYEIGLFEIYLNAEQEETACVEWYGEHLCKDAERILRHDNPELFINL